MADVITILTELNNIEELSATLKEDRTSAINEITDYTICQFDDFACNAISLASSAIRDTSTTSQDLVIGLERPEEIIKIAECWNKPLIENAAHYMGQLESFAKSKGFSQVSDFIFKNSEDPEFQDINYYLKYALMDLDNSYNYNTGALVYSSCDGWNVKMCDKTLQEIKSFPERFALINICHNG